MNLPVVRKINNLIINNSSNYSILSQVHESDNHEEHSEDEVLTVNVASNHRNNGRVINLNSHKTLTPRNIYNAMFDYRIKEV